MARSRLLGCIFCLTLVATACATEHDDEPGARATAESGDSGAPGEAGAPAEIGDWRSCGSLECATLSVPLDHARPDGGTIDLAIARRPAADPDRRIGTLIVNPGGPGGSGIDLLQSGWSLGPDIDATFDVVSWDPRGVGASTAVTCSGSTIERWTSLDASPDDEAEREDLEDAAQALAEECRAADGELLRYLGTSQAVEDLDLIREALGEEQISYVGLSYGTAIGQEYVVRYPDRVRAMVLDGIVGPERDLATFAMGQAVGIDAAIARMLDACEPGCVVTEAAEVYDRLATEIEDERLATDTGRDVKPIDLHYASVYVSYDEALWPRFHDALAAADDGDGRLLLDLADAYRSWGPPTPYLSVICLDYARPDGAEGWAALAAELGREAPRVGAERGYEELPCAWWPEPVRPPESVMVNDPDLSILIVSTTGDGATPHVQAVDLAERLPSSILLTRDGEGHIAIGDSACVGRHVVDHLIDLRLPARGTVCD